MLRDQISDLGKIRMSLSSLSLSRKYVSIREAIDERYNEQRLIDALRSLLLNNHRNYTNKNL